MSYCHTIRKLIDIWWRDQFPLGTLYEVRLMIEEDTSCLLIITKNTELSLLKILSIHADPSCFNILLPLFSYLCVLVTNKTAV